MNTRKIILNFVLLILLLAALAGYFRQLLKELPPIENLQSFVPRQTTNIYDINNQLIAEFFTERRTFIPLNQIPIHLQNAVLAIEDDKFFHHWGISPRGILRATINNLVRRRIAQGGSTITQQLSKVIFLTSERSFRRKIKELLLTLQLERNYSKQEILQFYLNQIYFGRGAYGVEAAAKTYFGKHASELDLAECALLAGLIRAPNYYSPFNNIQRAENRRATVLARMRKLGFISADEERQATGEPINPGGSYIPTRIAPYFLEYIRSLLAPKYGEDLLYQGGLSIYTTLDIKAQSAAEEAIGRLVEYDNLRRSYFENHHSSPVPVQVALVALDPRTGGIRAMVGGRDFRQSQFNRTYQAQRQPGSCFKVILYTAAIENGYSPTTILNDSPLVYLNDGRDWRLAAQTTDYLKTLPKEWLKDPMKVWTPENYKKKYFGPVLLRTALEKSLNSCAVQIIMNISANRVIDYARRLGIKSPLTNTYSLALGASDVNLLELTQAFGVLSNYGIRTEPYAIVRVEDKNGKILEENVPQETEVLNPATCFVMTNLLRGVVERGTGRYARNLGRPCAGKTGTTNEFTDAWFVGYTPDLVAGVWVGYDDKTPLGEGMTGGSLACPIWTDFMKKALREKPVLDFPVPSGINFCLIDRRTGLLALKNTREAYLEAFLSGSEPKSYLPASGQVLPSGTTFLYTPPPDEDGF